MRCMGLEHEAAAVCQSSRHPFTNCAIKKLCKADLASATCVGWKGNLPVHPSFTTAYGDCPTRRCMEGGGVILRSRLSSCHMYWNSARGSQGKRARGPLANEAVAT